MNSRTAGALAEFAATTLHNRAGSLIDRGRFEQAYPLLARSLARRDEVAAVAPDEERVGAQLRTANALHEIGLRVVRTGQIEAGFSFFKRSMEQYAAALETAETREERVEARFGTTLNAIAMRHSRKDVSDRWFSVGTLARPEERAGFYNRLTEAAAAHRSGGDMVAAVHAEGLARSVEATSPMAKVAGGKMTLIAGRQGGRVAFDRPAVWATHAAARRTANVFQSGGAIAG